MTISYRPLGARVLVRLDEVKEQTEGGLFIPQDTQDKEGMATTRGTVVALGDLAFYDYDLRRPLSGAPKLGDRVQVVKYAGVLVELEQDGATQRYRNLPDTEIVGVEG